MNILLLNILFVSRLCASNVEQSKYKQVINIHTNWYKSSVIGLLNAIQQKVLKRIPAIYHPYFSKCSKHVINIDYKARCVSVAINLKEHFNFNYQNHRRYKRQAFFVNDLYNWAQKQDTRTSNGHLLANFLTFLARKVNGKRNLKSNGLSRYKLMQKNIIKYKNKRRILKDQDSGRLFKERNQKSARIVSPKFLSLIDDEKEYDNILSPSLFSFYNNSKSILPIPQLLKGLNTQEKDAWMEFLFEATGAQKSIDQIMNFFENPTKRYKNSEIVGENNRIAETWKKIDKMYNLKQKFELDTDGYTFLQSEQLEVLYGKDGLYNISDSDLNIDLKKYSSMSENEKEEALENVVYQIAGYQSNPSMKSWHRRLKQTTLSPYTFQPSILSPGVLGPLTLSPNIFSPSILSPGVLNPTTLSPNVGNPAILSPYVLSPSTLSPMVMSPLVLSPYALSPNILTPFVLSPLILSPYVLSPDILSPSILGGNVLSPYVLSPSILNPTVLAANVLSPSVLSKK